MKKKTTVEDIVTTGLAAALHMASLPVASAAAGARAVERETSARPALPPHPTPAGYVADLLDD